MSRRRLDAELVRRNLVRSREHAREVIEAGHVTIRGTVAVKPATMVDAAEAVEITVPAAYGYVSRGAHKLIGALDGLGVVVSGRRALDAGASTGGFTQVLLERGAAQVIAVDVGYGQLAWVLQSDPRVTVLDRVNVRALAPEQLDYRPDLIVADLSFISLALVLPALVACADPDADMLVMVKPQFEVGRELVGSGGVVREPALRRSTIRRISDVAATNGWGTAGSVASPLPGPSGNVEYFLHLRRGCEAITDEVLDRVIAEGPE